MPLNVNQGFTIFHGLLTPTNSETQAAISHRASIEECLRSHFSVTNYFRCGSFGNGTSVSGYSDVDYLACVRDYYTSSSSLLERMKLVLAARFPLSQVQINSPAVMIPFGAKAESTEIVPAIAYKMVTCQGQNIYRIADGRGGWMLTCPDAHNAYVRAVDEKFNNKVKPLVRFLKAWKFYNAVPISSFFLEMYVARFADTQSYIDYSANVRSLLHALSSGLNSMIDPTSIAGEIFPCKSRDYDEVKTILARTCMMADNANECEIVGLTEQAFRWWNLVFNSRFASYNN